MKELGRKRGSPDTQVHGQLSSEALLDKHIPAATESGKEQLLKFAEHR